jgi:hypothetical protein
MFITKIRQGKKLPFVILSGMDLPSKSTRLEYD